MLTGAASQRFLFFSEFLGKRRISRSSSQESNATVCLCSMLFVPSNRHHPRDYFTTHHADLSGSHNLLYTHLVLSEIKIFVPFLVMNSVFVTFMHGFIFPTLCDCKYCAVLI